MLFPHSSLCYWPFFLVCTWRAEYWDIQITPNDRWSSPPSPSSSIDRSIPPLYLSLQQLVIGAILLRFLLNIRFLGSPGLAPWPLPSKPQNGDKRGGGGVMRLVIPRGGDFQVWYWCAKISCTKDNTGLSSLKIMQTTGINGVKNWWYTHSQSSCQPICILILTTYEHIPTH